MGPNEDFSETPCEQCGEPSRRPFKVTPHICTRCLASNVNAARRERRVGCEVVYADLCNEKGKIISGVEATCTRCDYKTESYGEGGKSVTRCLALMAKECPLGQENFYFKA